MKDWIKFTGIILFIVSFLAWYVFWTIYKYNDCKKVGHSKMYCVGKIFSE